MKAILLAGGEGTRLRPLSGLRPKPMVPLFDRPVLEHIVRLLRRHGITDLIITLQTLPQTVIDYFGDGSFWGVNISYMVEESPLGTAGGVRACKGFLDGDESFLIISGDAVCDIDLTACMDEHRRKRADVTLVLHKAKELLEYGLVLTDEDRRVTRFVEKPGWNQVFADTVNTGIYLVRTAVLQKIPEGQFYDFGRDLFPLLLTEKARLYGYTAPGYWCDIGDCDAYRRCCFDVLDGQVGLTLDGARRKPGLWLNSSVPEGTKIETPCYIGRNVRIGEGVRLGPYAILGEGTVLGDGVSVRHSVLDGAHCAAGVTIAGGIAGRGSVLREGSSMREGSVTGEETVIGRHAVLSENARVWARKQVEDDAIITGSITNGHSRKQASFDEGRLSGQPHVEFTPAFWVGFGAAACELGQGEVVLGHDGSLSAELAAQAVEVGIRACGGQAVLQDAGFASCAAYASALYGFALNLFISERGGELTLSCFDKDGLPLTREQERKLEAVSRRGELRLKESAGGKRLLSGMPELYAAAASNLAMQAKPLGGAYTINVPQEHPAALALRQALRLQGIQVTHTPGIPAFYLTEDGFGFSAQDERGSPVPRERVLGILTRLMADSGTRELAVRYDAPMALDDMGRLLSVRILRPERDGLEARALYARQLFMRDGVFAFAALGAALRRTGQSLRSLDSQLPAYAQFAAEVSITGDRGAVMRALADGIPEKELYEGLRARVREGWVHVSPLSNRRALRIVAEGVSMEAASEICDLFSGRAKVLDKQSSI